MLERLMTLNEVTDALRVSVPTLRRAVKSGELQIVRTGRRGHIRVEQSALDAFLRGEEAKRLPPAKPNEDPAPARAEGVLANRSGPLPGGLSYRLLTADVLSGLAALPSGSVSCAVTSPPYFWQRDYGVEGQIGKEPTIEGYVQALVRAFREMRRVLAEDGLFFLNLGDGFYNAKGRPHGHDPKHAARMMARRELRAVDGPGLGLPRKSLIGMPWRVALALQADGWVLRSAIVWNRPGVLGEPTGKDRPHRAYEMVFMFSRTQRYFFDRGGFSRVSRMSGRSKPDRRTRSPTARPSRWSWWSAAWPAAALRVARCSTPSWDLAPPWSRLRGQGVARSGWNSTTSTPT